MNDIDPAELRLVMDEVAIRGLQARYGDVITRRAWDELPPLFLPDAPITLDLRTGDPIELIGPVALGEMVDAAVQRFEFFEFALLNSVIDQVSDDRAGGRLYMWELRQEAHSGRWTNAFGLYRDEYVRHEGRWVIARRRYSSLARTGRDSEVFDIPPLG